MGAPLCTTAQVEALLQHDITPDNDPRVVELIAMATADLEAIVGRELDPGPQTGVAVPSRGVVELLLPHWPLASVEAVIEDGDTLVAGTDYATPTADDLARGQLRRRDSAGSLLRWPDSRYVDHLVVVDYTPTVPAVLAGHAARLVAYAVQSGAAAAATSHAGLTGLKQLTVGRWSATAANVATAPGIVVDDLARQAAEAWRDRGPA